MVRHISELMTEALERYGIKPPATRGILMIKWQVSDLRNSDDPKQQWAADELNRLQAIVDALPKDAEGNAVYPGRQLVSTYYDSIQQPRTVVEIWTDGWKFESSTKYRANDPDRPCYGSVEAAEKARKR